MSKNASKASKSTPAPKPSKSAKAAGGPVAPKAGLDWKDLGGGSHEAVGGGHTYRLERDKDASRLLIDGVPATRDGVPIVAWWTAEARAYCAAHAAGAVDLPEVLAPPAKGEKALTWKERQAGATAHHAAPAAAPKPVKPPKPAKEPKAKDVAEAVAEATGEPMGGDIDLEDPAYGESGAVAEMGAKGGENGMDAPADPQNPGGDWLARKLRKDTRQAAAKPARKESKVEAQKRITAALAAEREAREAEEAAAA